MGWGLSKRRLGSVPLFRFLAEAGLAVLIAFLCFVLLLLGVMHRFPEMNLAGLWPGSADRPLSAERDETASTEAVFAKLTTAENEVRRKSSAEIIWSKAYQGLSLSERDAVQTLENSRAIITFNAGKRITLEGNSLVVLKGREEGFIKKETRPFVEIVSGTLHGNLDATRAKGEKLEVVTPTATVELQPGGKDRSHARFRVDVRPDKSSNVTVYQGSAKVQAQGVSVEVGENQVTHIGLTTPPSAPQALPDPVLLVAPDDGKLYVRSETLQEVVLTWASQDASETYHVQVSDSPGFLSTLVDETRSETALPITGLEAGVYFWRVAALDKHGVEAEWSLVRSLEVVHPGFGITFPEDNQVIAAETIWVEGEATPTEAVYLNGIRIMVNERGHFKGQLSLTLGTNLIVAEAVNPVGASRFQTRTVVREP